MAALPARRAWGGRGSRGPPPVTPLLSWSGPRFRVAPNGRLALAGSDQVGTRALALLTPTAEWSPENRLTAPAEIAMSGSAGAVFPDTIVLCRRPVPPRLL